MPNQDITVYKYSIMQTPPQKFLSAALHSCGILLLFHNRWRRSGGVHCRALNSNHIYSKNPPAIQKAQGLHREQNVHKNPPDNWEIFRLIAEFLKTYGIWRW